MDRTPITNNLSPELLAAVEKINQLQLEEDIKALALTILYKEQSRNDLAIEALEKLVNSGSQSGSTYLILGSLCEHECLNERAEKYYEEALKLAISAEIPEEQIAAKVGIGKIKSLKGLEEGNQWLKEAKVNFDDWEQLTSGSEDGERLRSLIVGEQQILFALLGQCGDCGPGLQWTGIGINRRCIPCGG